MKHCCFALNYAVVMIIGQGRTAVLVQGQEVMVMKEKQEVEAERHRKIRKIVICRLKSLLNKNNNFSGTLTSVP
jgi:hypothetical protein